MGNKADLRKQWIVANVRFGDDLVDADSSAGSESEDAPVLED